MIDESLVIELAKRLRKVNSLPTYRNPKDYGPCPDESFKDAVNSRCPVCDAWEFKTGWPIGVHCINLCMYPKWFVDQFNYDMSEIAFKIAREKSEALTMEEVL